MRMRYPSLRWQLALLPGLFVALLVAALLGFSNTLLERDLRERAAQDLRNTADSLGQLIGRALDRRVQELRLLARDPALRRRHEPLALRHDLDTLRNELPGLSWLGVIDLDGAVRADSGVRPAVPLLQEAARFEFGRNGVYLAELVRPPLHGGVLPLAPAAGPALVGIGVPLRDEAGRVEAVLAAHLERRWFESFVRSFIGQVPESRGVAAIVLMPGSGGWFGSPPLVDEAWLRRQMAPAQAGDARQATVQVARLPDGAEWLLARARTLPLIERPDPNWQVLALQDQALALRPAVHGERTLLAVGVGLALVLGLAGFGWSRALTRPYASLLDAVARRGGQATLSAGLVPHLDELSAQVKSFVGRRDESAGHAPLEGPERALQLIAADVAHLRQVLDRLPVGVTVIDTQAVAQFWNPANERLFGWSSAEVVGRPIWNTFARGLRAEVEQIRAKLSETTPGRAERGQMRTSAAVAARDGRVLECVWTTISLRDAAGAVIAFMTVAEDVTDQRRAEQALRDSEAKYRLLFENNPQAMAVYDRKTTQFLAVNEAAVSRYGWTRDEFMHLSLGDLLEPGALKRLREHVASALGTVEDAGVWHLRRRDGSVIDVEIASHEIEFNGQPARLVSGFDVTTRERALTALRASRQQYLALADNLPVGVFRADAKGHCEYVNAQWCAMTGMPAQQALGDGWVASVHPDDLGRVRAGWRQAAAQGGNNSGEHRLRGSDGRVLWVWGQIHALRDDDSGLSGYVGTVTDMTERRAADEQLRIAATAFEQQEGIVVTDPQGVILRVNRAFTEITGFAAHEAVGRSTGLLRSGRHDEEFYRERFAVLQDVGHWSGEIWNRRKNGEVFPEWINIAAVKDEYGRVTHFVGSFVDITERKRAESALIESQHELEQLAWRLMDQEKFTTRRLAQALHDRLGQTLAAMRLQTDAMDAGRAMTYLPEPLRAHAQRVRTLVDQAVHEVRAVLVELRPPLLDDQGLAAALDNELHVRMRDAGAVALRLQLGDAARQQRWPADVEYVAFMIAREAIGNALLHAGATRITCRLEGDAKRLCLSVKDDGAGLPAGGDRPGHLGVVGMRERALAIGAKFALRSLPQAGATAELHWQLEA